MERERQGEIIPFYHQASRYNKCSKLVRNTMRIQLCVKESEKLDKIQTENESNNEPIKKWNIVKIHQLDGGPDLVICDLNIDIIISDRVLYIVEGCPVQYAQDWNRHQIEGRTKQ